MPKSKPTRQRVRGNTANNTPPKRQPQRTTAEGHSIKRVSDVDDYTRITLCMQYFDKAHGWSFAEFIKKLVTAEPNKQSPRNARTRAQMLNEALQQPGVRGKVSLDPISPLDLGGDLLVSQLQTEIKSVAKQPLFKEFNIEYSPNDMQIQQAGDHIKANAPGLTEILYRLMERHAPSPCASRAEKIGPLIMIYSILAFAGAPQNLNNFATLLGLYAYSTGTKGRFIAMLHFFGLCPSYKTILRRHKELSDTGKVIILIQHKGLYQTDHITLQKHIREQARNHQDHLIVCWDNFDYNKTVHHQSLREPNSHLCATTGKLSIGHNLPQGGLNASMFRPLKHLTCSHVVDTPGNGPDDLISCQIQRHWIAEAIRYAYPDLIDELFKDCPEKWPQFPVVERLAPHTTEHYGLGPILANEGTIDGTYDVIDTIFRAQFGADTSEHSTEFNRRLQLVYGDQKTVSLIQSVQEESDEASLPYHRLGWIIPVPGLFHLRMNFIDMIHDLYSGGGDNAICTSTLTQNATALGCIRGSQTPFHYKQQLALRAFDARVTAFFHDEIGWNYPPNTQYFNTHIQQIYPEGFLNRVERIRYKLFSGDAQSTRTEADNERSAHAKFLQQMEVYKTLKQAIKVADIGILRRIIARCCLLFIGSSKSNYAHLSLYMTWLTQTEATTSELQRAILANGLVNQKGREDTWYEMDRLNEFFNLTMKNIMANRRSSSLDPTELFQNTALTASYYRELQLNLDKAFGERIDSTHTDKKVHDDVRSLGINIFNRFHEKRQADHQPQDILEYGIRGIADAVFKFNERQNTDQEAEEEVDAAQETMPIHVTDGYISGDET